MAMTYLTKLKPEPMGAHSLSAAYGVNSLVMSEDGAAAYISVKDVPAGTPLTNTEYWRPHTDLTSVKQSADAAAQKANAARDEMLEIARSLTDAVEKSGNPVQAELVGGLPFDRVATMLEFIQSGSGDPSPDNIRAISGWTGVKLTRCGKNLLPDIRISSGGFTSDGNGVFKYVSNNNTIISTFMFKAGVSYTISATAVSGTGYKPCIIVRNPTGDRDGQKTNYGATGNPLTFSFDTDTNFDIILQAETGNGLTTVNDSWAIQLELGSTATAYEPYQGDTYSADFSQTVYGGTLDWQTGVLTVDKAIKALTGTESVVINNSQYFNAPRFEIEMVVPGIITTQAENINMICSHYEVAANPVNANDVNHSICAWMGGSKVYLRDDAYSTVDEYKAYLAAQYAAGTPVQVCYKLATPTTIQLTPQEIKQLQGVNTLYGDGSISMTGRADKALALEARIAALEAAALAE